jgi:3-methyladenine DNA glycosylase Tag
LCFCVFNSGIRQETLESKWAGITRAFATFRVDEVAGWPADHVEVVLVNREVMRNKKKITGCFRNASEIQGLRAEWGSFASYLMDFALEHGPGALADDVQDRFSGIGPATGPQFLKDLGFDMFKADAHVRNVLSRTGLISAKTASLREIGEAFDLLKEAEDRRAGRTDSWLSDIDWVLFCYGKGTELEYPVCKSKKPLCNECGASSCCPKRGVK